VARAKQGNTGKRSDTEPEQIGNEEKPRERKRGKEEERKKEEAGTHILHIIHPTSPTTEETARPHSSTIACPELSGMRSSAASEAACVCVGCGSRKMRCGCVRVLDRCKVREFGTGSVRGVWWCL
jgi:hypothetical protein